VTGDLNYFKWGGYRLAWVDSSSIDECLELVKEGVADGISISPNKGWKEPDLSLLRDHKYLKAVVLVNPDGIDISDVMYLQNLRLLSVGNARQPLDLSCFPSLRELALEWHPKVDFRGASSTLEKLHLRCYRPKSKNLVELPPFPLLSELSIVQSPIESLEGLEKFRNLRSLELSYLSKLKRIGAIAKLNEGRLDSLECLNCPRIDDYEKLRHMKNLKVLRLNKCGPILNLNFVKEMSSLRDLRFVGTDVQDGDLTPLLERKTIESLAFTSKRHFSHSESMLRTMLGATEFS